MKTFFELIKEGDRYLNNWPKQKVLNCLFIDSKVGFYTRLAIKILPVFVVLAMSMSLLYPAYFQWSTTATFALFSLSLPAQGLYWLGKRSETFLPNQLLPWYVAIEDKLARNKNQTQVLSKRPRYSDLAHLLTRAFEAGGDDFLQKHELV